MLGEPARGWLAQVRPPPCHGGLGAEGLSLVAGLCEDSAPFSEEPGSLLDAGEMLGCLGQLVGAIIERPVYA